MGHITENIWWHKSKKEFRWWLHWGKTIWHYEGYLFKNARHTSIGFNLGGDENDITIHAGVYGLFNFYFGVEDLFPRKIMRKLFDDTRVYGISAFDGYISIEFHRDDYGYSKGWKGYHKMINWKNILFGKETYRNKELGEVRGFVQMPEGKYPSTIKIEEATWTRRRFKKPLKRVRYEVTPDTPIPEPGKGENGWDLDDDALHSGLYNADSVQDALNKVAESVMKTRIKRAGKDWIPQDGFKIQESQ